MAVGLRDSQVALGSHHNRWSEHIYACMQKHFKLLCSTLPLTPAANTRVASASCSGRWSLERSKAVASPAVEAPECVCVTRPAHVLSSCTWHQVYHTNHTNED